MIRARYAQAADIFAEALDRPEPDRDSFIADACEGDDELRSTVESLLRSDADASFLDTPYTHYDSGAIENIDRLDRAVAVGHYRVKGRIALGGMAAVLLAEQENPHREVALKLLFLDGTASDTLTGEAAALGRLQHPNIARVYEAGTATVTLDDGDSFTASYIAMEYIQGVTLADFATSKTLDRRDVATLLLSIAGAIGHAHQRGVVHRDLKPSNILVDHDGGPHIIDFGVGIVRDGNTSSTASSLAGTISYMAPEQLLGQLDRIDTRADIFALGAIGYELIAGKPLHAGVEHLDDAVMARIVESSPAAGATFRAQAGGQLARVLRRATEPSLDRRYQSASEFAEDLRRVLDGRPLDADEASALRALAFYARRHKAAAAAIVVVFVTLAAAVAVTLAASSATERALVLAESLREDAAQQALHSERIADFLKASFLGVDPEELGADVTLFDAIDYASGRIHRDLADVPEVEADVRGAIGFVYRRHGRYADALEQIRIAHRLHSATLGPTHPRTLGSAEELGYLTWLYEGDPEAALAELNGVIDVRANNPDVLHDGLGWIHMKVAAVAFAIDNPRLAAEHLDLAQPLLVGQYGEVYAARTIRQMAMVHLALGETDEALQLAQQALAMCEHAAEQEYIAERARLSLGSILITQGDIDEARKILNTALIGFDLLLGKQSLEAAATLVQLAWLELESGDPAQAQMYATRAAEIRRSLLATHHPEVLEAEAVKAVCIAATSSDYFDTLTAAFDTMERAYGPDHRESLRVLRAAAQIANAAGDSHSTRRFTDSLRVLETRRIARVNLTNADETNR